MVRRWTAIFGLVLVVLGCSDSGLPALGPGLTAEFACPCAEGFECDPARKVCVAKGLADAHGSDQTAGDGVADPPANADSEVGVGDAGNGEVEPALDIEADAAPYVDAGGADSCAAAAELCNDSDDDCNGQTDEGCDLDKDGYCTTAMVTVGKPKACPKGGGDCGDANAAVNPGAAESCATPGVDDDCDGKPDGESALNCTNLYVDADQDGYGAGSAKCLCNAGDVATYTAAVPGDCDENGEGGGGIYPGAVETCGNGIDDNCAGGTDEGCGCPDGTEAIDVTVAGGKKSVCTYLYPLWGYLPPNRPASDWTASGDQTTVTDIKTKLVWQRSPPTTGGVDNTGRYDWQGAINYCDELALGGADDWRLPTVVELQSVVDYSKSNPAADTSVFDVTLTATKSWYWTRTPFQLQKASYKWFVDFSNGYYDYDEISYDHPVRCVR